MDHTHRYRTLDAISSNTVKHYLADKEATRQCEACGNPSWSVSSLTCELLIGRLPGGVQNSSMVLPVTIALCDNCGNLRLFSLSRVEGRS